MRRYAAGVTSSPRRRGLRRDVIVDAAAALISAEGLDSFTLRRLADRFEVSAPALYTHFTDKNDVLRAVAEHYFAALTARYADIDANADPDRPLDRVREQCRTYVNLALEDPELFRVMFLFPPALRGVTPAEHNQSLPAADEAVTTAISALEDAIELGQLEDVEPLTVALSLWAAVHGIANLLVLGVDPTTARTLVDEVTTRILLGYGARD